MARLALRLIVAAIGIGIFVVYAAGAVGVYLLAVAVWSNPETRTAAVVMIVVTTVLFGLLSYVFGTRQLLAGLDAVELPRHRMPELHARVDRLTDRMVIRRPTLYVADLGGPNALAVGGLRSGAIVVDPRLLQLLGPAEQEAIVAHEMAHLESYDGLIQTLAYSCLRTLVGLCVLALLPLLLVLRGIATAIALTTGRPRGWPTSVLATVYRVLGHGVSGLLVALTLLVRAHSRRREYAADDRAVAVTGNPRALASALYRIHRATDARRGLLAPLYVSGRDEDPLTRLLSTHPRMEDRIERLRSRPPVEKRARPRRAR